MVEGWSKDEGCEDFGHEDCTALCWQMKFVATRSSVPTVLMAIARPLDLYSRSTA